MNLQVTRVKDALNIKNCQTNGGKLFIRLIDVEIFSKFYKIQLVKSIKLKFVEEKKNNFDACQDGVGYNTFVYNPHFDIAFIISALILIKL